MPATTRPTGPPTRSPDSTTPCIAWLPGQRWFPAKGREVAGVRTASHAVISQPG